MSSPYITFQSGPSKANQNQTIPSELITDPAVQDAIDQINRRFQTDELRLNSYASFSSSDCPSTLVSGPSSAFKIIPALSVPLPTHGRDVFVGLQYDPTLPTQIGALSVSATGGAAIVVTYRFLRDGSPAYVAQLLFQSAGSYQMGLLPGSFWFIDRNVPVGAHYYDFQVLVTNANTNFLINGVQLVAYELGI